MDVYPQEQAIALGAGSHGYSHVRLGTCLPLQAYWSHAAHFDGRYITIYNQRVTQLKSIFLLNERRRRTNVRARGH
jgi:hypothetical protein